MNALVGSSLLGPRPSKDAITGLALEWTRFRMWIRVIQLLALRSPSLKATVRSWRSLMKQRSREMPRRSRSFARAHGRSFFAMYAPGFPSRAFDRFAVNEIERSATSGRAAVAQTAIFAITARCGLNCEHCCEWKDLRSHEALSVDQLHGIVEQMVAAGTSQLFLSGGEPLLRLDDLLGLVARFSGETDIWVLTAGGPLTVARARGLRDAGLTGISLSLDHWNPEAHDAFRGKAGAFESARTAAIAAREAGLVLALSLCPTRGFVTEENLRTYRDLAREWGAAFIQVLEPRSAAPGHPARRSPRAAYATAGPVASMAFVSRYHDSRIPFFVSSSSTLLSS